MPHSEGTDPREVSCRVGGGEKKNRKLTAGVQGGTLRLHTPKLALLFPTLDYLDVPISNNSDR